MQCKKLTLILWANFETRASWLTPVLVDWVGWEYAFTVLVLGPLFGILATLHFGYIILSTGSGQA